ncbi:MAG TPA: hypothetical protein VJM74_02575 [Nitrososphaeraceae archaeon]|nr:hypothetical protein [Nitrososphaeraceae archaeon]
MDFFEIERVLDELARTFAAPSATTWFKVTSTKTPNCEEYRRKVVEFMSLFESSLLKIYQNIPNSHDLLDFIRKGVGDQIAIVLAGQNKDVEKRYKYYVEYR